jgi:hypothetical protein
MRAWFFNNIALTVVTANAASAAKSILPAEMR